MRTIQEITAEYNDTCAKAGHYQYQIAVLKDELDIVNAKLRVLNKEAAELTAKEKENA